jgi:hypothetical protein
MKKYIPYIIMLSTIAGWIAAAGSRVQAQTPDPLLTDYTDQSEFPQVTAQPIDQAVPAGSNVVLSVQAVNADGYQWLRNGVPVDGETNSIFTIEDVGTNDVALYSCEVSKDAEIVPTRAATVSVVTAAAASSGTIIVYGTPVLVSGKRGTCPGAYVGYVAYTKPASQGWGWAPLPGATGLAAADGSGRTDTKIQYLGAYGDTGCAQTTVTIPYPAFSPVYRFNIYFASDVPTNAHPIVLTGFKP